MLVRLTLPDGSTTIGELRLEWNGLPAYDGGKVFVFVGNTFVKEYLECDPNDYDLITLETWTLEDYTMEVMQQDNEPASTESLIQYALKTLDYVGRGITMSGDGATTKFMANIAAAGLRKILRDKIKVNAVLSLHAQGDEYRTFWRVVAIDGDIVTVQGLLSKNTTEWNIEDLVQNMT